MRPSPTPSPRFALARAAAISLALGLVSLAGCGATTTTSVSGVPHGAAASAARTSTTSTGGESTAEPSTTTTTTGSASAGGTAPTTTARSAPEPKFVEGGGSSGGSSSGSSSSASSPEGLAAAMSTLTAHGYVTKDTAVYHPNQTLRVLVGTREGSSDGYAQQAFFFVDGNYIGTDASAPSAHVTVLSQGDTEVTLGYPLYRVGDPLCCPGGGQAKVRFQLDDGRLVALDPIPAVEPSSGSGRR
ncbi:MAG TPA: LppP/LprE family lipoprotein [Solirubrobacteraceae bacterium]|nr:LppP/LprE family lipoprotein [Solirubrobacteraceae bacterium]